MNAARSRPIEDSRSAEILRMMSKPCSVTTGHADMDLSENKRAAKVLKEREALFGNILDNLDDLAFKIDTSGNITYINKICESITGKPREELIGKLFISLFSKKSMEKAVQLCNETLNGKSSDDELTLGNGRTYHFRYEPLYCEDKENIVGIFGTARDITERRHYQEALASLNRNLEKRVEERTARLAAANEEHKQFAYVVSHDLRTPLLNLKGFSEELRSSMETVQAAFRQISSVLNKNEREVINRILQEEVPEALFFIEQSVTKMDRMINAVLQLSRLGCRDLQLERIDMNELTRRILDSMAHQIEQRGAVVTVEKLPETKADRKSMEQIMSNILDNALKYLHPERGGEIKIAGEREKLNTVFRVRDNGRGIAREDIPKVFMIFRRAGAQDVPGEGIGLSFAQVLVRRHGGKIWFESEPGVGTTFSFSVAD